MLAVIAIAFLAGAGAALLSVAAILRIVEDRAIRRSEPPPVVLPTARTVESIAERRRRIETTGWFAGGDDCG